MIDGNRLRGTRPLTVYLGDLTYTTLSLATDAFPLNIGFIAAYAAKSFGKEIDLRLFKYVDDLEQAILEKPPDILGLEQLPMELQSGARVLPDDSDSFASDNPRDGRSEHTS